MEKDGNKCDFVVLLGELLHMPKLNPETSPNCAYYGPRTTVDVSSIKFAVPVIALPWYLENSKKKKKNAK